MLPEGRDRRGGSVSGGSGKFGGKLFRGGNFLVGVGSRREERWEVIKLRVVVA